MVYREICYAKYVFKKKKFHKLNINHDKKK